MCPSLPLSLLISLLLRHQSEVDELTNRVHSLEQELSSANELLAAANKRQSLSREELLSLSPRAARASELLKSGLSLTQIYSRYVEVDEERQQLREENAQLGNFLNQVGVRQSTVGRGFVQCGSGSGLELPLIDSANDTVIACIHTCICSCSCSCILYIMHVHNTTYTCMVRSVHIYTFFTCMMMYIKLYL